MKRVIALTLTAAVAVTIGLTTTASAEEDPVGAATDVIAEVAPNQQYVETGQVEDGGVVVDLPDASVTIPIDSESSVAISSNDVDRTVSISLPNEIAVEDGCVADDGTVIFPADGGAVDAAVQVLSDGSVQIETIINDATAPRQYTYSLDLPAGTHGSVDSTGAVSFVDANGNWVAGLNPPWAKDANGEDVPTHYVVEGTTVTQVVSFTADTVFPVVADPWLGIRLIDNVTRAWVSGKGYRYSVYPSIWGRSGGLISIAQRSTAWADAKAYYPSGMNTASIRDQFYCHWDYKLSGLTMVKGSWNLESWSPYVSYSYLLSKQCNV